MMSRMKQYQTIDEYIGNFPAEVQSVLQKLRSLVHELAPTATEAIKYGIPTFVLNGNLVHFAAYEKHIGFYPGAEAIATFAPELKKYDVAKGTVRFYLDQPLPFELVKKIVRYRVEQAMAKKK